MFKHLRLLDTRTAAVKELSFDALQVSQRPDGLIWIDVEDPTRADLDWLGEQFGFHALALEDCLHDGQRPKIEAYDSHYFLDVYAGRYDVAKRKMEMVELDIFIGGNFLVTSHMAPLPVLDEVLERWKTAHTSREEGAGYLLYLLLDTIVDDYFPIVDDIEAELEELEDALFEHFEERISSRIFCLKKELLIFRKLVVPTRDVCLMLMRRETPLIRPSTALYFQDVYDHLIRVADSIDTYRDLIGSTIEAYMSMVANRTNDTMKRLTTISAILMTIALVPSVYGMNFHRMPELEWHWGYPFALSMMLAITLILSVIFKKLRYF